jgi:hypothetical protein
MDVVLRDNLLEWYNRQWYDSDGPKEEPKAEGAPVLSTTLPPYGPLTIAEVVAAMEKAGSKKYVHSFMHSFVHVAAPCSVCAVNQPNHSEWRVMRRSILRNPLFRYEAVAKQLALRLAVPGNAARLKLLRSLILHAEAQIGDDDGSSLLHSREH